MGFGEDVKAAKADIESTFVDLLTVQRWEDYIDEYRTPQHRLVEKYKNVPCFISYSTQNNDNPNTTATDNNPIQWKPLILTKLEFDIQAGDEIVVDGVMRENHMYKGVASDVCKLLTHTEFNIGIKKEA